jgi:hypothetical protein
MVIHKGATKYCLIKSNKTKVVPQVGTFFLPKTEIKNQEMQDPNQYRTYFNDYFFYFFYAQP